MKRKRYWNTDAVKKIQLIVEMSRKNIVDIWTDIEIQIMIKIQIIFETDVEIQMWENNSCNCWYLKHPILKHEWWGKFQVIFGTKLISNTKSDKRNLTAYKVEISLLTGFNYLTCWLSVITHSIYRINYVDKYTIINKGITVLFYFYTINWIRYVDVLQEFLEKD